MTAQVTRYLLRLVFVLVVARALGAKGVGVYALVYAMFEFLMVASGAGYPDYLTREAAKDAQAGWGLDGLLFVLFVGPRARATENEP